MSARASLRRRIVVGVICYTVAVSLVTMLLGYGVNERAEQRTWEALLESGLAHWAQRDAGASWTDSDALQGFGAGTGKAIPEEFRLLAPGVHDEIGFDGRTYVVLVQNAAPEPFVLALDISEMEDRESSLALSMVLAAAAIVALLGGLTYLGAHWLVRPLYSLSRSIRGLHPGVRNQQVAIAPTDPAEIEVIAQALNEYLKEIDAFVLREQAFLTTASHELRTPLAVVAGATEVALEQPDLERTRRHLRRILATAGDMRELIALLLVLAKDPSRLVAGASQFDLAQLVPRIVDDHQHLVGGKELALRLGEMAATPVLAPMPIAQAAIGNLIRNAIENSDRGEIRVSLDPSGVLSIENPASDISAADLSQLQARIARQDNRSGDGIGLDLIERICSHLGWSLVFDTGPHGSTIARLAIRSS